MKLVYIAGPFSAPTPWGVHTNVAKAERVAARVAELGAMPVCPHTNTANFVGIQDYDFWCEGTMRLLEVCDAIVMVECWGQSAGSCKEHKQAIERNMPIFYASRDGLLHGEPEFQEWLSL